jgi:hypothetical protein
MIRLSCAPSLLCAVFLAACGDAAGAPTATVTDSAGVQIATSTAPAWSEGEGWVVDSVPSLDIGGSDIDPHYDLVQVADAAQLADGRIVIMTDGASDLRFYDSTGTYRSTTGRAGDGPGEFRRVASIQVAPGDTLYLYDYQLRRLNRIAPDGSFLASTPVTATGGKLSFHPLGRLPDGSWVATAEQMPNVTLGGIQRDSLVVLHLPASLDGIGDTVGTFPGTEMFMQAVGEGESRGIRVMQVPLGLSASFLLQDSLVDVGDPAHYEIKSYRTDGALARIIRRPVDREPLTRAELNRWEEDKLATVDDRGRERLQSAWQVAPIPSLKPAFGSIHADPAGNLWVEHAKTVASDPGAADIFDPQGRLLGSVALPASFSPLRIGRDFILGVWKDEDGLEHVRRYAIKGKAGGREGGKK